VYSFELVPYKQELQVKIRERYANKASRSFKN